MKKFVSIFFWLVLLTSCTTLKVENDILSSTDEDYTHGTEFVYHRSVSNANEHVATASRYLPDITTGSSEDPTHVTVTVGQHIYTPSDLRAVDVIENDNPYAGWLFGSLDRHTTTETSRRTSGLTLGVVGKYSFAERAQKFVHEDLDKGTDPKGWHNQLGTEVGVTLLHERENIISEYDLGPLDVDVVSNLRTRVGNIHTDLTYGREVRIGKGLPRLTGYQDDYSLYWYSGVEAAGVARNIFYDGNTFKDSHRVGSEPVIGKARSGVKTQILGWEIDFKYTYTSPEHQQRDSGHGIWMLSISKALQDFLE
jgi:hypothetical protein